MGTALVLASVGSRGRPPTLDSPRRRNEQYPHRRPAGGVTRQRAAAASVAFRPARSATEARSEIVATPSGTRPRPPRQRIPVAAAGRPPSSAAASPPERRAREEDST